MKVLKVAVAATALSLGLAACGSGSSGSDTSGKVGEAKAAAQPATIRLWLNGTDTPQAFVDQASAAFAKQNPGSKLVFERQQWTGIVDKLTTSLSSSDSPDVVELGNTQAQAFEAAGALRDLTADRTALGGDDLLQSLVEAGTYDGKLYAAPYYAGARVVVYRKDMLAAAGLKVPTTLSEFIQDGQKLKAQHASDKSFSGIYFPGKYWYAALPFIWQEGGDIATQKDGTWTGQLSSPGSQKGLEMVKTIMDTANGAPKDSDESKDYVAFCHNEVAMLMGPGWKVGQILDPKDGCPALKDKVGAFALPGDTAGSTAPAFLGGSVLGISAKSKHPELSLSLLKILTGLDYQKQWAQAGVIPARKSLLDQVSGDEAAKAQAQAAANSRFVPSSPNWAGIEASTVLPDMLVSIARGGSVADAAKAADQAITSKLNAAS